MPTTKTKTQEIALCGIGAALALFAMPCLATTAFAETETVDTTHDTVAVEAIAAVGDEQTTDVEPAITALAPVESAAATPAPASSLAAVEEAPEATSTLEADDAALTFAKRLYTAILGRTPDEEGLSVQYNALKRGVAPAEIAYNYFMSEEYQNKREDARTTVNRAYQVMFGHDGDEEGIAFWNSYLETGMSIRAVIQGFSESDEYHAYFASNGLSNKTISRATLEPRDRNRDITQFAQRLYTIVLGRAADDDGLNCQTEALLNQVSSSQIATNFFSSEEFANFGYDTKTVVEIAYRAILGRDDAAIEADEVGRVFWVNRIDHGGLTYAGLSSGFCQSPEFTALCAAYGMNPGVIYDKTIRVDLTGRTVVFLGDSITWGSGLDAEKGELPYSRIFTETLGGEITNLAVQGASFANREGTLGVAIDQAAEVPADADVIVIMFGTNDYGLSAPLGTLEGDGDTTLSGLAKVIETVKATAPDATIVGIIPPTLPGDTILNGIGLKAVDYKNAIAEAYSSYGIMTANFSTVSFTWKAIEGDTTLIHPNAQAHQNFGAYLVDWYRSSL